MTLKISTQDGFARALLCLAEDVDKGIVVSCSLHYEPTHVARMSVCYIVGHEDVSDLPGLPGVEVEVDDTDPEPWK